MQRDLPDRSSRLRRLAWIAPLLFVVGCQSVGATRPWFRSAIHPQVEKFASVHSLSDLTETTLRRDGFLDRCKIDPEAVVRQLESRLDSNISPVQLLAISELSLRIGYQSRSRNPVEAMERFRDSAVYATSSLSDDAPESGQIELAIGLHNRAIAALIPMVMAESTRSNRSWTEITAQLGLQLKGATPFLAPERFSQVHLAEDYLTKGFQNTYRNDGLGVPLVAYRIIPRDHPIEPNDGLMIRRLYLATTAVVVPPASPLTTGWRAQPLDLHLMDPFGNRCITVGRRSLPLATDRSTPLAVQITQAKLNVVALRGLFNSSTLDTKTGLYMLRPYQPGKIPIVLIHGLFSTPEAWDQTINELQNDPEVDAHYQVWFYLYPSGNIVPQSAATLRRSLQEAVTTLDPSGSDPSLQRMVVVGHSLGGLLTKMMAQDTGERLWNAVLTVPRDRLEASEKTREYFTKSLIYERLPFVDRIVFVATPHRGSRWGTRLIGRVVSSLVEPETALTEANKELADRYGKEVSIAEFRRKRISSVGNLAYHDPILMAIDAIPIHPAVPFHSIIMEIPGTQTDGVVGYKSAHLDGAVSEHIVAGTHVDQKQPLVTDELKRILREHRAAGDK